MFSYKKISFIFMIFMIFFFNIIEVNSIENKNDKKYYLILNDIDAFMDLNKLVDRVEYLNENGISFLLDVRPIYLNTNLESMEKFAEALRYAQSKGGYIILDTPYIQNNNCEEDIVKLMKKGFGNFLNYKVYPIAMSFPIKIINDKSIKEFIEDSKTIFLKGKSLNDDLSSIEKIKNKNIIIQFEYSEFINYKDINCSKGVGICLGKDLNLDEFKDRITKIRRKFKLSNLGDLDSNIKINNELVTLSDSKIYLNKFEVTQNRFISREEFNKSNNKKVVKKSNSDLDISNLSNIIMIFALIASIIFIIIAILSRKIDRNKYFK